MFLSLSHDYDKINDIIKMAAGILFLFPPPDTYTDRTGTAGTGKKLDRKGKLACNISMVSM
ncbi:hypothetical protein CVD19_06965 [Bacillus sp. T33-2]|nr:hypothetical protein CVD19_06965 [Bacillus sp. T33-2]